MHITSIKTNKVIRGQDVLVDILDRYLKTCPENSVLAVTSKIVAICEGRVVSVTDTDKDELIKQESDYYLPRTASKYDTMLTINRNILIPAAGIDESNGNGYYILWPADPQKSANTVREYLKKRFGLHQVGVIITDSKTTPLRWGTTGISLAHSGFAALNSYIQKPDIFGRNLKMTKANVTDALSAAAVLAMGEGNEQTPLALMEDLPFVKFQPRNPIQKELQELHIALEDDVYAPVLMGARWKKGKVQD